MTPAPKPSPAMEAAREIYALIEHGDEKHRAWLKEREPEIAAIITRVCFPPVSPEEQAKHREAQRQSRVRGEMAMGETAATAQPGDGAVRDAARWRKYVGPQTALMLGSKLDPNDRTIDWLAECNRLADLIPAPPARG